jgi:hypothetical protein
MAEGGRPKADIDWNYVNELLTAGCSGREIAGEIGLNCNTIYDRCEKDHGISFSEYSQQFYAKGDTLIRKKQFDKAIKEGDNTLLIWLGKNRLKQSDYDNKRLEAEIEAKKRLMEYEYQLKAKQSENVPEDVLKAFDSLMSQFLGKSNRKRLDSNTSNDK